MMAKLFWLVLFGALCLASAALNVVIPEVPEQLQAKASGEEEPEDAEAADKEFDDSLLSKQGRPTSFPDLEKTKRLYEQTQQAQQLQPETGVDSLRQADKAQTELVQVNLYLKYYTYSDWYHIYYRCCPRKQNYGCLSNRRRLPCHSHYVNGVRQWCCPFSPTIYIANCNCSECAIFTSTCIKKGRCHRRYRWRTYYAVCYRNSYWGYIRRLRRLLPSSCYCRAR
ncbi:hypothetical protein PoB_002769100 [Plakobranchus ocellatus]|uniref:Uncharacterized protein n=1 Tax=Plakobranchus ocellatus TaxID=259542 RepID=A0AAV4A3B9_9GAST|nr:hypothetical protein PoB_002769100 [Plakobranchus ocellatus]